MKRVWKLSEDQKRRHREVMQRSRRRDKLLRENPQAVSKRLREEQEGPQTIQELMQCDIEYGLRVVSAHIKNSRYDFRL